MPPTKTTVYLDEPSYARLKRIARAQGRPTASLVREAVMEYAARHDTRGRPKSIGAFRSKRHDLSERAEDLLNDFGRT
jgi:hypothetical protein